MKPQQIKKLLFTQIRRVTANPEKYSNRPGVDFSRNRKLPLERLIVGIIGMDGGSLSRELLKMFHYSPDSASGAAFVQQREKLKPEALEEIFRSFSAELSFVPNEPIHLLAVDGTDVQIFADPKDPDSYYPGANDQKPYSLLHVNALYDLRQQIYLDAIVQKGKQRNEHTAFCSMVDRSDIAKAIVIADRGYESYNDMAHIQEKGWYYLIRVKDGRTGIKVRPCIERHIHHYRRGMMASGKVSAIEFYQTTDPFFNRFPSSSAFTVFFVDPDVISAHLPNKSED